MYLCAELHTQAQPINVFAVAIKCSLPALWKVHFFLQLPGYLALMRLGLINNVFLLKCCVVILENVHIISAVIVE